MLKSRFGQFASALILILGVSVCVWAKAAPHALSADDVTLLLIGGASSQRIVALIQQRGIDFKLNPDLAKQFFQDGATDAVMDALQRASEKVKAAPEPAPAAAAPPAASSLPGPKPVQATSATEVPPAAPAPAGSAPAAPAANPLILKMPPRASVAPPPAKTASQPNAPSPSTAPLPDPSPDQIQHIIQSFAAKELLFKEARDNYTYHQINKVETLDADGQVNGTWEQDWDILFDAQGNRVEKVTYAPSSTLTVVTITEQDINAFRNIQPFVLTTPELPEYSISYLGHVHVDYLTCYVFSVRPKEIKKGHQYFDGVVWVDDHDLQIVKAEGRNVPQGKQRFPRFTTWRQQIDGKYWFPTFTLADDILYFPGDPPVHIKEIVKYTDYKWFGARVKILSVTPVTPKPQAQPKH